MDMDTGIKTEPVEAVDFETKYTISHNWTE